MIGSELRFNFGDIIIALNSLGQKKRIKVEEPYKSFLTRRKPNTFLRLNNKPAPPLKNKRQIFSSGSTWSLYRQNGNYILKIPDGTVIFNQGYSCGEIYLKNASGKNNCSYLLEYPLDEILMINLLASGKGMIVHGCGVIDDGLGILFIGSSGAGKSTLANLWKNEKNTLILSDERVIIRKIDTKFWIYGTPWYGEAKLASPAKAPLKKIFFLRQAKKNIILKVDPLSAVSRLIVCSFLPFWDADKMNFTLEFCSGLSESTPFYELGFLPDKEVLDFIKAKI